MRTTVDIDVHLLKLLRAEAERRGTSFRDALAGALRRGLAEDAGERSSRRYECPSFDLGDPMPAIDLDKALGIAAALEDEAIIRKCALLK